MLKLQENNKKRFATKEIMIMKKLMLLIALLFMGSAVSAASAEAADKKYSFSLIECSGAVIKKLKTLASSGVADDIYYREFTKIISEGKAEEKHIHNTPKFSLPEFPPHASSEDVFLRLIKDIFGLFEDVVGVRYIMQHAFRPPSAPGACGSINIERPVDTFSKLPDVTALHLQFYTFNHFAILLPPLNEATRAIVSEIENKLVTRGVLSLLSPERSLPEANESAGSTASSTASATAAPSPRAHVTRPTLSRCANPGCTSDGTLACSGCKEHKETCYCSVGCQKANWNDHKKVCEATRAKYEKKK